jgi:hypothetical protein
MTGDFEVDDVLHRHGAAIAEAINPYALPKFTMIDALVVCVGVYIAIAIGLMLNLKPYVTFQNRSVETVERPRGVH